MQNTYGFETDAALPTDGQSIMERLGALADYKTRIGDVFGITLEDVRDQLLTGSPPAYYDTIRIINISGGADCHVATVNLKSGPNGVTIEPAAAKGARIRAWGSIGEMPDERPGNIDLFAIIFDSGLIP